MPGRTRRTGRPEPSGEPDALEGFVMPDADTVSDVYEADDELGELEADDLADEPELLADEAQA